MTIEKFLLTGEKVSVMHKLQRQGMPCLCNMPCLCSIKTQWAALYKHTLHFLEYFLLIGVKDHC